MSICPKLRGDSRITPVVASYGARHDHGQIMALAWGVEQLGRLLKRAVPLTRYRVHSLRPLGNFDQGAARTRLGWQPRVGLRRGLDATFGQAAD